MPYTYPHPVEQAKFITRPNRFTVEVEHNGKRLMCHLPNPGRMLELLKPNAMVLITLNNNPKRKTRASVVGIVIGEEVVQLQSNLVANWLPVDFSRNLVPGLEHWKIIKQEYTLGPHRYDFLLSNPSGTKVITEVKSTTRVRHGIACFPDGVSKRATQHLKSLMDMAINGNNTMIIFVVQRQSESFWPCESVDSKFTEVFKQALKIDLLSIRVVLGISKLIDKKGKKYIHTEFVSELPVKKP